MKELQEIEEEMKRGECVTLEEAKAKHGAKKLARFPRVSLKKSS